MNHVCRLMVLPGLTVTFMALTTPGLTQVTLPATPIPTPMLPNNPVMTLPEKIKEKTISSPCAENDYNTFLNIIIDIYYETMKVFGDALEIVNKRFDIPCGRFCLEGSFDAFSIETKFTQQGTSAMVDVLITIKLLRPLIKPSGNTITCLNPFGNYVGSYPDMNIINTLEEQYKNACGHQGTI